MTSFPVPDSPWMSTVLSVGATCSSNRSTSLKRRDLPSGLTRPETSRRRISCLSCVFAARRQGLVPGIVGRRPLGPADVPRAALFLPPPPLPALPHHDFQRHL